MRSLIIIRNLKLPVSLRKIFRKLKIHQRVAVLISTGLFLLGLMLVLFINIIAPLFIIRDTGVPDTIVTVNTIDPLGKPITILVETPAPIGNTISQDKIITRSDPIMIIRILSIIGLVVISTIGILGSRWLAKISLQPIGDISQAARHIDVKSLNQRLNYQGPEDEVKLLADTFDAMLTRLDINFERQGQFVSNLAHELRTPLSSLHMNIEAINLNSEANLEDYHNLSETAERALARLEQLVEDLLLLAKGENEISHDYIIIGVLIDEILEEVSSIAKDNEISLSMEGDIDSEISGDAALIQSAITNLIKNGIYYNHPDGFVRVVIRNEATKVVIAVQDNGIGITNEDQTKIFDRFYRARKEQGDKNLGKGLGLAIAKHVVELHQGKIEVESKLGIGSTFRIFLPSVKIS